MPGTKIDIPNIDSAVGYYFDAGTFVWSLIVIGVAVFYFLVRSLGFSLLARAFRILTAFVTALALVGFAAAFGWARAVSRKKEDKEKEKKKNLTMPSTVEDIKSR